jgi:hypothetical protein
MSSSFEWLELEVLSREIADLEDRLAGAKSTKNHGLMRLLDKNLGDNKRRREQVLEAISRHTASTAATPSGKKSAEPAAAPAHRKGTAEAPAVPDLAAESAADTPVQPAVEPEIEAVEPAAETVAPEPEFLVADAASPASVPFPLPKEGATTVWDQLTPEHLDQAKRELARRRAEILARHAEELKALEADQGEIDTLDQAIAAFTRKFSQRPEAAAEIVQFNEERGLRMHAPG